jgi:hypothetical protein
MQIYNSYLQKSYQSNTSSINTIQENKEESNFSDILNNNTEVLDSYQNDKHKENNTYQSEIENKLLYPHLQYGFDPTFDKDLENVNLVSKEWFNQLRNATNENKYEDASEFEAFVNKWIENGATEIQALERAMFYSQAGLLDYGNQRAIIIDKLGFGDKKQHGMHLIHNDALKNAMIETFDSLDNAGVGTLVERLFMPDSYLDSDDSINENLMFQDLIDKFASEMKNTGELEKLNSDKYFDGNINISNDMTQEEKNFIYDSLLEYLNNHISKIEQIENKYNESWSSQKEAFALLIYNFKMKINN